MKEQCTAQTHKQASIQTYRFEFGTDETLHAVSFKGVISEPDIRRILETARNTLYEKCGDAIRSYLDSHHREYSDFRSGSTLLDHGTVMEAADHLLYDSSCEIPDGWIGNTDEYYAVIDHRRKTGESCEGCYFVILRTSSLNQSNPFRYYMIGQKFRYDEPGGKEQSHFAIRQNKEGHHLHTIDKAEGEGDPVLATFGCIDLPSLLSGIRDIQTKEQAASLAHR